MLTAIIFIIVISILIFVHEFGHFVVAKRAGMKVEEFGFGFPPRLWGLKRGDTTYSINWIPFGGFVKIYGEDGQDRADSGSFSSKSVGVRLGVVLAGVVMNFFFAMLLLMLGNGLGLRIAIVDETTNTVAQDKKVQVIQVVPESPAETGGLRVLDAIKEVRLPNGSIQSVRTPKDLQDIVTSAAGQRVGIITERGTERIEIPVTLRSNPPPGQGPLGVSLALTGVVSYPWYQAIWRGAVDTVNLTINTVYGYGDLLAKLITTGKLGADVSGPIGIASITGQAARIGFSYLIQLIAIISVNLAVLNIIPFPALDGGRALMLVIEKIKGSPVNVKVENAINTVGFFLLLTLMVLVTIKDIGKYF
ncbi:MAG: M50 family metallopeptidase [Patescibacteria group bacterium]